MVKDKKKAHEQQRRRRKNYKPSFYVGEYVELITGDLTRYPAAFCSHYEAFLTYNMKNLHRCEKRKCPHLHNNVEDYL